MTTSMTSFLRSLVVLTACTVFASASIGTIVVDDLVAAGNVQPATFTSPYLSSSTPQSPYLSSTQLQSIAVTDKTMDTDSMAGQISSKGGSLYFEDGEHYLALHGMLDSTLVVKDPSDHASMHLVTNDAIASTLPRFAVFVTNNTASDNTSTDHTVDQIPYTSLILKELVKLDTEHQSIVYNVEVINKDASNASNGAAPSYATEKFDSAMLMIDLTPFGADVSMNAVLPADVPPSKSLRHHIENAGKPQTLDADGNEVGAQGIIFTWWAGPFMYFCCPYGFMTLPFVLINPFSLPWVFAFCCL